MKSLIKFIWYFLFTYTAKAYRSSPKKRLLVAQNNAKAKTIDIYKLFLKGSKSANSITRNDRRGISAIWIICKLLTIEY